MNEKKRPMDDVIAMILSAGTPPDVIEHLLAHADECDKHKPGSGELFRDAADMIAAMYRRLAKPLDLDAVAETHEIAAIRRGRDARLSPPETGGLIELSLSNATEKIEEYQRLYDTYGPSHDATEEVATVIARVYAPRLLAALRSQGEERSDG